MHEMISLIPILQWLLIAVVCFALGIALVLIFGRRQTVPGHLTFAPAQLPDDLDSYLANNELAVGRLKAGTEKHIRWAHTDKRKTHLALVYIHGFSSSAGELRPVPDHIADSLGANLFFTRLSGHGHLDNGLDNVDVSQWLQDLSEAIAIGTRLGHRVVVMATSTGGTLASLIPTYPRLEAAVSAIIFISPNFGPRNRKAELAGLGAAKRWLPWLIGKRLNWASKNAAHDHYWTLSYSPTALIPMIRLIHTAKQSNFRSTPIPAFFLFSEHDTVVNPEHTKAVIQRWGSSPQQTHVYHPRLTDQDDAEAHVIAGDIRSPQQNAATIDAILQWMRQTLDQPPR